MSKTLLSTNDKKTIKKWIKKVKKNHFQSRRESYSYAQKHLILPYPEIGCGKHRIVFDLQNGYVLKVALSVKGVTNNKIEAKLYQSVRSSLRKYLAPVIDHGKGWVIMERFDVRLDDTDDHIRLCKKMMNTFRKKGVQPNDIFLKRKNKIKKSNIRLNQEGELVVIDYGNFEYDKIKL